MSATDGINAAGAIFTIILVLAGLGFAIGLSIDLLRERKNGRRGR